MSLREVWSDDGVILWREGWCGVGVMSLREGCNCVG